MRKDLFVLLLIFSFGVSVVGAQQAPAPPTSAEPAWLSSLTPSQRVLFDEARKDFGASDYKSALPKLRRIHDEAPQNDIITKFAAEASVNTGDYEGASALLVPVLRGNADDPQALGIQAHLYGQQHDVIRRDEVLDHIQKLHDAGKPAPAVVIVETAALAEGKTVRICDYIEPQSRFHIVLMAEFLDGSGKRISRIALESDDIDQVSFKKEHPDQAAAGVRVYSMDSYGENRDAEGKVIGQTHGTLCPIVGCFMVGRPTYEFFRKFVLDRKVAAPISTATSPSAPEPKK